MPMQPFGNFRPDIAFKECRFLTLEGGAPAGGIPAGQYGFLEWYCDEPDCDCQRMLLTVVRPDSHRPLATIGYCFDRTATMAGPYLDPVLPQSVYSEEFLDFVEHVLLADKAYVERCRRHYELVKQSVGRGGVATSTAGIPPEQMQARIARIKTERKRCGAADERRSAQCRRRPR